MMQSLDDPEDPSMDFLPPKKKITAKSLCLFFLKLIGTGIFLYWAFSLVEDKDALAGNFKLALTSPFWLICGIGLAGIALFASALRLYVLLRAMSIHLGLGYITKLTLIAALFSVTSFGTAAGDAMKMISIMRRYPDKKVIITMTVMVDHMVGFISSALIFLLFGWGFGTVQGTEILAVKQAFLAATAFQVIGIITIVGMFFISSDKTLKKFREKLPRIASNKHLLSVTTSLNIFRTSYRAFAIALAASFILSSSYFLCFYVGLRTVGEQIAMSTVLTVMPIVDVVSSLPITISGLGVRERTFDFLISELAGIHTSSTVSASLIGFLFHVFWGLVGGFFLISHKSSQPKEKN